jgi:hypothetical protein
MDKVLEGLTGTGFFLEGVEELTLWLMKGWQDQCYFAPKNRADAK